MTISPSRFPQYSQLVNQATKDVFVSFDRTNCTDVEILRAACLLLPVKQIVPSITDGNKIAFLLDIDPDLWKATGGKNKFEQAVHKLIKQFDNLSHTFPWLNSFIPIESGPEDVVHEEYFLPPITRRDLFSTQSFATGRMKIKKDKKNGHFYVSIRMPTKELGEAFLHAVENMGRWIDQPVKVKPDNIDGYGFNIKSIPNIEEYLKEQNHSDASQENTSIGLERLRTAVQDISPGSKIKLNLKANDGSTFLQVYFPEEEASDEARKASVKQKVSDVWKLLKKHYKVDTGFKSTVIRIPATDHMRIDGVACHYAVRVDDQQLLEIGKAEQKEIRNDLAQRQLLHMITGIHWGMNVRNCKSGHKLVVYMPDLKKEQKLAHPSAMAAALRAVFTEGVLYEGDTLSISKESIDKYIANGGLEPKRTLNATLCAIQTITPVLAK